MSHRLGMMLLSASCLCCLQRHPEEQRKHKWQVDPFPPLPKAQIFRDTRDPSRPASALFNPLQGTEWRTVEQARYMRKSDLILGLYLDGRAWAMPWWVMKNHHVANIMTGARPVLMTFCEVCSGGSAFLPTIDGKRHTYRLKGLYNGTHFIADDQTGSFWQSFGGDSFWGPLKGTRLERLPLHHCTWAEWLALHPETLVANGENESRLGHGRHYKGGGPGIPIEFMKSLLRPIDQQLPSHTLVVGVAIGTCSRAYPLSALDGSGPVVNDTLCGSDIGVFHKPGSWFVSVLSRRHDGNPLAFEAGENGEIRDGSSGSRWNYEGEALDGPLRGQRLDYVPWAIEEWYTWTARHPQTEIYGR